MFETELKFQIPTERLAGVQRAVATATARTLRLRARYFDTPERHLASAAMALRLRLEGDRWVQTLKGRGDGMLQRLEHEVVLVGVEPTDLPALDLSRHDGTPAGEALRRALGRHAEALACRFETDVTRVLRLLRRDGSRIELALDLGEIRAGDAHWPLQELEFELKAGPVDGLLALAGDWAGRHRLWLDVRSKAERGERLASGIVVGPPVAAAALRFEGDLALADARRQVIALSLAPVLANLADRADPRGAGHTRDEHVHQARVGLRRLRGLWRLLDDGGAAATWLPGLVEAFAQLGGDRDRDVLAAQLREIGHAPTAPLAVPDLPEATSGGDVDDALAAALRTPAWQHLWLSLIAVQACDAGREPGTGPDPSDGSPQDRPVSLLEQARPRLQRLWRQIERDAQRFERLADGDRHRLRKRLKRLRDGLESLQPLLRRRATARWLTRMKPAQEALGLYNDLCVCEQQLLAATPSTATAYALGWLAGRRGPLLARCGGALQRLCSLDEGAGEGEGLDVWPRR